MKTNLVLVLAFLLLFSCEKSEESLKSESQKTTYYPLTTGSYWIYDIYEIDSAGNETLFRDNDTVRVVGDTIIDSKSFQVIRKKPGFMGMFYIDYYYRDTAGYILDAENDTVFQYASNIDTVNVYVEWGEGLFYWYLTLEKYTAQELDLHFDFTDMLNYKQTLVDIPEQKVFATLNHLFAPNVGLCLSQISYVSRLQSNGGYYEARLVEYYISE